MKKAKWSNVSRPRYITVLDEIGMKKSMPVDERQFEWRVNPALDEAPVVFLGLGPEPDKLPKMFDLPHDETIYFLETDEMIRQVDNWESLLPNNFERISPEEFTRESAPNTHVVRYLPSQRVFPSFFGPLTARLTLGSTKLHRSKKTVWLPFSRDDLLGRELANAFKASGYQVYSLDHEVLGKHPGNAIPEMLANYGVPDLFFSINFKGLDHFGLGAHILREAGTKVAVWMVDNPFNLMPAVKSEYWKTIRLYVTDHTFIGPLLTAGARSVTHLPLAASPELMKNGNLPDFANDLEDKLVFVGRSEFPKKNAFFAGLTPEEQLLDDAVHMLERGARPHFHWWQEHINAQLWPGNEVRKVGVGAEVAGYTWKERCLSAAGAEAIIFGDEQWGRIESIRADTRPLLDYYGQLPAVYRAASVNMNATGMQLPAGLTQRHFDVWAAGGFLITDANPGLKIFPDELTEPVIFKTPSDILPLFERYKNESAEKTELREAWQQHILAEHTYDNRVKMVLKTMGLE